MGKLASAASAPRAGLPAGGGVVGHLPVDGVELQVAGLRGWSGPFQFPSWTLNKAKKK